jgi:hypothetical protein
MMILVQENLPKKVLPAPNVIFEVNALWAVEPPKNP